MFSNRTPHDFSENALTRKAQAMRQAGATLLDLTESNPTRAGFLAPPELLAALGNPLGAHYSPDPRGLRAAREAVSRDYASRGVNVDPEHIVLTASSSESYSLLFKLLANPGDDVLVPTPSYPLFGFLADLDSVLVRTYPLRFDHEWHLSVDALSREIGERTRAVVVVHPNNPTGSFLKRTEACALSAHCAERGLALIADEVFADFVLGETPKDAFPSFALDSPALSFTLGGLSKSCVLPQLKLGWIVVSGPAALRDEAIARLEFIADTYLSAATPIQLALAGILEQKALLQAPVKARLARNFAALKAAVAAHPELTLLPVEGGWSALVQCPATRSDEERALIAMEAGVLVHPGHFFDFDSGCYLVVSLLCETSVFDAALPLLMNAAVR
ncbi:MAG: pyridoxal phosphate-dependent aminotransferase [Vicinamibacteria bacterium]|jgi:alanine-synthesizing transaminase|nr:pyridoxal phosphate-dependent aminotransferase [Vicinamibacteria bacterium]